MDIQIRLIMLPLSVLLSPAHPPDLYVTIFGLPLLEYAPIFVVVSLLSGALVAMSYQNTARFLKGKSVSRLLSPLHTSPSQAHGGAL